MEKLDLNKLEAKEGVLKVVHENIEVKKRFYKQPVEITGTITAPGNYIEKRKDQDDEKRTHVKFSYKNRFIKLVTKENSEHLGSEISGGLFENPDLKEFGLNQNKMFNVKELVKHLRMNKFLFASQQQNENIVKNLQTYTAKVNSEIKNINDNRGNIEDVFKTTLSSNMELSFDLKMPVFIGEPDKVFKVEVACEADNTKVNFWLESPDLIVLLQSDTKTIIDKQLARFPETFVFIEQ